MNLNSTVSFSLQIVFLTYCYIFQWAKGINLLQVFSLQVVQLKKILLFLVQLFAIQRWWCRCQIFFVTKNISGPNH